jgi:hypothetical protein
MPRKGEWLLRRRGIEDLPQEGYRHITLLRHSRASSRRSKHLAVNSFFPSKGGPTMRTIIKLVQLGAVAGGTVTW